MVPSLFVFQVVLKCVTVWAQNLKIVYVIVFSVPIHMMDDKNFRV